MHSTPVIRSSCVSIRPKKQSKSHCPRRFSSKPRRSGLGPKKPSFRRSIGTNAINNDPLQQQTSTGVCSALLICLNLLTLHGFFSFLLKCWFFVHCSYMIILPNFVLFLDVSITLRSY